MEKLAPGSPAHELVGRAEIASSPSVARGAGRVGERHWLALIATVGGLAGAIAILVIGALGHAGRPIEYDDPIFLTVGRSLVDTGLPLTTAYGTTPHMFFDHTPLWSYWVGLLTALGGDTLSLGRVSALLFGIATVAGVFYLVNRHRGPVGATVAALLVASSAFFAEWSWFMRMETALCCVMVLALIALDVRRWLTAGLLVAGAVVLKEVALAFWLVAVLYAMWQRARWLAVALPAPVGFAAWLAYAAWLDLPAISSAVWRWVDSAGPGTADDWRNRVGAFAWAEELVRRIVGPVLALGVPLAVLVRRRPAPPIAWAAVGYVVVATVGSFVITMKEPRFMIAVIPMAAIAIGLLPAWPFGALPSLDDAEVRRHRVP